MGEAINLVNNFKVEKVIFNCGPYNDLEEDLIIAGLTSIKEKYGEKIKELFDKEVIIPTKPFPRIKLQDLYKGFIGRREWLALLTDKFRITFESLLTENQQLKDEVKRLNNVIDEYHEEEMLRQEDEMMDYLIKDEKCFNDYSFMED